MTCIILLIVALARPRKGMKVEQISTEGVAMMIAVDRSGSMGETMLYKGQQLNRLEVVKKVVTDFIAGDGKDYQGRMGDMIGLVTYARYADTQCPLVRGNSIITDFLKETELVTQRAEDGTAIGDGLATAISRLQDSEAISKVIILLTDGVNNAGSVDPLSAAEISKMFGIRVYTIGVGSRGYAPYPVQTIYGTQMQQMEVQIDEELLQQIAQQTNGRYFRAENNNKLRQIYNEIDKLEKSKIDVQEFKRKHEMFLPFALFAVAAFIIEILLRYLYFRKLP